MMMSDHPIIGFSYWILRKVIGFPVRHLLIRQVSGLENIPTYSSAILAFNHQSFFDFICFASVSPRNIHFLSAEKFFEHFFWRLLMKTTGQIKVNRLSKDKSELYKEVNRHVVKGSLIGIFPEGTRSPHKEFMLKAFSGVAHFALKHGVPVIPVGIKGTYEIMSKFQKRPNIKRIVDIHIGRPLNFVEHHGKHDQHDICEEVTEQIMKKIEELSQKKYYYGKE